MVRFRGDAQAELDRVARTFWLPTVQALARTPSGRVVVLTAGTSDLPVAQEAVVTARALLDGYRVEAGQLPSLDVNCFAAAAGAWLNYARGQIYMALEARSDEKTPVPGPRH